MPRYKPPFLRLPFTPLFFFRARYYLEIVAAVTETTVWYWRSAQRDVDGAVTECRTPRSQVTRKEVALGMAWRKYRRLEADMIRSRMELMDTLSDMENERKKHAGELEGAKKHGSALEAALRTADEVMQKAARGSTRP